MDDSDSVSQLQLKLKETIRSKLNKIKRKTEKRNRKEANG